MSRVHYTSVAHREGINVTMTGAEYVEYKRDERERAATRAKHFWIGVGTMFAVAGVVAYWFIVLPLVILAGFAAKAYPEKVKTMRERMKDRPNHRVVEEAPLDR